jgi:hypothetical protein
MSELSINSGGGACAPACQSFSGEGWASFCLAVLHGNLAVQLPDLHSLAPREVKGRESQQDSKILAASGKISPEGPRSGL